MRTFGRIWRTVGKECIKIPVYQEMKDRVPDACKGSIPYHAFICAEAPQGLKAYLQERKERFGDFKQEEPLFCSDWTLWKTEERVLRRETRTADNQQDHQDCSPTSGARAMGTHLSALLEKSV